MTDLVIIRGLPGSGKTTMAKRDFHDYVLCEADQYFGSPYRYNPKKIQQAHGLGGGCSEKDNVACA